MLENLITDRTAADFQRWQTLRNKGIQNMTVAELAEWENGMKGAYNSSDLNRVGEALTYVKDRLAEAGYLGGNAFYVRTDWKTSDIPTASDLSLIIQATEIVRAAMAQYQTTPATPDDIGSLDIEGANNIEKILIDVDELITKMQAVRYFGGDLYGGEI